MSFQVSIRHVGDSKDITVIGTKPTRREAERIERGINMNLNHDDYYVAIIEVEDE